MVQGLGFLSKKSWHTKNLNNQEKVWIAEQQQEQERIRTTELAKQIQIEREQNEINDITGGNTKKKTYDRGIDWMYTGQTKDSQIAKEDAQKMAEEYLLGKPIAFHGAAGSLPVTDTTATTTATIGSGINRSIDAVVGMSDATTTTISAASEHVSHQPDEIPTFKNNHKYEDPMYAVSLQTVRKEKMIEHQKELYQKVGIVTVKASEDIANNTNDDNTDPYYTKSKAHKKSKKKKSKKYDSDDSRHRKHAKRHPSDYSERHRTDKSSSRKRKRKDYDDDSYGSGYSCSSYSDDRKRRQSSTGSRHNSSRADSYHEERHHRHRDYNNDHDANSASQPQVPQQEEMKSSRYGLVTKNTNNRHEPLTKDLGPDMELVQRKREEKYKNQHPNHRYNTTGSDNHRRHHHGTEQTRLRPKNAEERARALRAMEEDAKSYDATRRRPPTLPNESNETSSTRQDTGTGATFLHEISQKVHGVYD